MYPFNTKIYTHTASQINNESPLRIFFKLNQTGSITYDPLLLNYFHLDFYTTSNALLDLYNQDFKEVGWTPRF